MKENNIKFKLKYPRLYFIVKVLFYTVLAYIFLCMFEVICVLLYIGIGKLATAVSKLDAVIIVALITGIVSISSSIIAKYIDYNKARKEYLAQKREQPYSDFIEMVYKIQGNINDKNSYTKEDMITDIKKFSKLITLWGSSNVVNKWNKFRENGADPEKAIQNMFVLEEIMNEMRKDLGLRTVRKGGLLSFFVNDIKDYIKK